MTEDSRFNVLNKSPFYFYVNFYLLLFYCIIYNKVVIFLVLFKLFGFIEINYQIIISFFVGIVVGIELFLLFYALLFLISIRNKKVIQKSIDDTEIEAKAKDLIESSRIALSDKVLRGDLSKGKHFKNVCFDLIYGISSTFYPDSKYPQLELTISEAISLLTYIQDRLNEILDKKFIRIVKNRKLSFIWEVTHVTNDAINSNTFKTANTIFGDFDSNSSIRIPST